MQLPTPVYEALPYIEAGGGVAAILMTGFDPVASFFGAILLLIGNQVLRMRRSYRAMTAARIRQRRRY
jgi:hypothetical protein